MKRIWENINKEEAKIEQGAEIVLYSVGMSDGAEDLQLLLKSSRLLLALP
jgi:hypothetical protein